MSAVYETERLIVRPWTLDDADVERVFDTYSRWEVARWLGAQPRALTTREQATKTIEHWRGLSRSDGPFGLWAAQVRSTGVAAGSVLLVPLPEPSAGEVEVGWHLHPDSERNGYATEAGAAVIERGFRIGVPEVFALIKPDNPRSQAVARRLGMRHLGRTTRYHQTELELFHLTAPHLRNSVADRRQRVRS